MSHIYIAGPLYGSGHQDDNVRAVLEVAGIVQDKGHIPFVPHLYYFWNLLYRRPRQMWLDLDKEWLRKCDAMLRIEGESPGSTLEEEWCTEFQIPWEPIRVKDTTRELEIVVHLGLLGLNLGAGPERLV